MRALLRLSLLVLPAACAPLELYYKPGASLARLQEDQTTCEVAALRDVPVASQTRVTPPYYVPGRRTCSANGNCTARGGFWYPGDVYTVDVNAPLRQRVTGQCMAKRGYAPTQIPLCPLDIANAAAPGKTQILPTLTKTSCAIRNRDGSFQIVNRS